MIKNIMAIIVFYLMGIVTTLVAQAAVVDLGQTILLEGSALNFSVIVHQSETAFFTIELVDSKGKILQNYVINPDEGVNNYAFALPINIQKQAWLLIRNGDQTQLQELLILPRPKQLIEWTDESMVYKVTSTSTTDHKQTENICLQDYQSPWVYISSTAATFHGRLLQFDQVKDFVHYPIKADSGRINQAFLFEANSMKSLKMTKGKKNTTTMLKNSNAGSALIAVNKLTNLPEKLDFTLTLSTTQSIFNTINSEHKNWLANQLLIDEVVTPLNDKDFSATQKSKENINWQKGLGTATVDLIPQNYVAYKNMKSFLGGLAKNLRLYSTDDANGSYVYPINKKASLRQPLYIIDGQIAKLDDLLSLKQDDVLSIKVYTKVKTLIQTLGPVASAGLIVVKTEGSNSFSENTTIGQELVSLSDDPLSGTLSPIAFRGISSKHCYDHNMRLGVFNVNVISIEGKILKIHSEQINITPISK